MKKFMIIASCAMMLLAAGCKQKPVEPESIIGTTVRPVWTDPEDYDMSSSMTAIVKVDLSRTYTAEQLNAANYQQTAEDLVAAFSGDKCLGVAEQVDGLFFLYITAPEDDGNVTLKHYSSVLKNLYTAEPFPFRNDQQLGTVLEPYSPKWAVIK
ncbi:MAG: hypothetical protein J5635_03095 [Paludibacteraceae bacterium]|nr:hypothetical protein [Paludibacteraceae bacterium]